MDSLNCLLGTDHETLLKKNNEAYSENVQCLSCTRYHASLLDLPTCFQQVLFEFCGKGGDDDKSPAFPN